MIHGKKHSAGLLLIIILTAVTVPALLRGQSLSLWKDILRHLKPQFLLAGLALMLGYVSCEAVCTHRILGKLGHHVPFRRCLGYSFVGFYASSITPSASGGQPAQIYYMSRGQIPAAHGTLDMMLVAACYQSASVIWGGAVWLFVPSVRRVSGSGLRLLLLYGAGTMLLLTLCLGTAMFLPNISLRICGRMLKILTALRLIKNPKSARGKLEHQLSEYAKGAAVIKRHPGLAAQVLFICMVQLGMLFSIPWMVYLAFGMNGHSWIEVTGLQALLTLAVCNLPLPGAAGAAESCFVNAFASAFGADMAVPAMLVSRGISFYLFLLLSLGVSIIVHLRTSRQTRGHALREMTACQPGKRVQALRDYLKSVKDKDII